MTTKRANAPEPAPPAEAPAEPTRPLLWDVPGAAQQLNISERHAWTLIAEGRLRALKVSGRTVVADHELERFVAELPQREVG